MEHSDGCARRAGPIGVFDSGVGGLSVLRDIRAVLPHETLLTAHDLLLPERSGGGERFWASGDVHAARRIVSRLWGCSVGVRRLPDAFAA
jgi:glutamate racemase